MGKRFQELYKVGKKFFLTPEFFNTRFNDVDDRISLLEAVKISWQTALAQVQDRVLERSEDVISSLRDKLVSLTQLQWLTATSGSVVLLAAGQDAQFLIAEADRELFTPGPYSVVSRDGDANAYAIIRNVAYDRTTGQWATHVEVTFGDLAVAHNDWSIAAVAGSTLAQRVLLDQGRALRDAAAASASNTQDDAAATALDRIATGQDRQAVRDDRVAGQTARAGAELAAAAAATFDPSSYPKKDGTVPFTGLVAGQTAAVGDNSAKLATTAFAQREIAAAITALKGGAGTAYDTLVELQNILQADESAAAALATLVGQHTTAIAGNTTAINALKASPAPTLDDLRALAIQLAKLKGSTVGMAGGVADDFKDQTGLDTATSVASYPDQGTNTISNIGVSATDDLPAMTGYSAPAGQTASASSEVTSSFTAWMAYDGTVNTGWAPNSNAGTVQRTSSAARTEVAYAITTPSSPTSSPSSWTRWGSNDGGTTKTALDTQSGQTWAAYERRVFVIPVANRAAFKTYGLTVNGNNGATYLQIQSIESLVALSGVMDLRSVAFPAQAVPTKGSIFVLVKATSDAIVANTNLLAKLSRDGGTTYTTATLTSTGTFGGFTVYEANGFDLTAQPSGSSMKWRVQTVGAALTVQVDAVVAQWG